MDIFMNFGLAWVSVIIAVILAVAYFTRIAVIKLPGLRKFFVKINKAIRKHHKALGLLLIATALLHGLFSSDKLLSLNLGTVSWLLAVILGINWILRKKLIKYRGWMFYHRILVVLFSLSIIIHVIDVGGIQVFNVMKAVRADEQQSVESTVPMPSAGLAVPGGNRYRGNKDETPLPDVTESPGVPSEDASYIDGTYTGEATGFQPGLVVSVEIKDGQISSVTVVDHNEINSRYYQKAIDRIPQMIVDSQSTDVDAVSGATYTSNGIMKAVENALDKASGN